MSAISDANMNPAYAGLTPQGAPETGMPTGTVGNIVPDTGMPSPAHPSATDTDAPDTPDTGMPKGGMNPSYTGR
jgi:hypothetical protein